MKICGILMICAVLGACATTPPQSARVARVPLVASDTTDPIVRPIFTAIAALKSHSNDQEIVDLTVTSAFYGAVSQIIRALFGAPTLKVAEFNGHGVVLLDRPGRHGAGLHPAARVVSWG